MAVGVTTHNTKHGNSRRWSGHVRRDKKVSVPFTAAELEQINAVAFKHNISFAAAVRKMLFQKS